MSFIKSIVGWFKRQNVSDKDLAITSLSLEITRQRHRVRAAKKAKKRSSHLQKQLEVLVARKLELEGK